jgi:hypothetical protein
MLQLYARVRMTATRACVEHVSGMFDGQSPERAAQLTRPGARTAAPAAAKPGEIVATPFAAQARYALRCTVTK